MGAYVYGAIVIAAALVLVYAASRFSSMSDADRADQRLKRQRESGQH